MKMIIVHHVKTTTLTRKKSRHTEPDDKCQAHHMKIKTARIERQIMSQTVKMKLIRHR